MDAMSVSQDARSSSSVESSTRGRGGSGASKVALQAMPGGRTPGAADFWRAAVERGKDMKSIGDRTQLFYHLYTFLKEFEPTAIEIEKIGREERSNSDGGSNQTAGGRRKSWKEKEREGGLRLKSWLGEQVEFPEHLFEQNQGISLALKKMFGFSSASVNGGVQSIAPARK